MKTRIILYAFLGIVSLLSLNCATILKGYEDTVTLENAPDSIRVLTQEGIEIPVKEKGIRVEKNDNSSVFINKTIKQISLRNNQEYTLHLKYHEKEKIVTVYPKLEFKWAFYDFILGIFPTFYDAYTGCWNTFPDIDSSFK